MAGKRGRSGGHNRLSPEQHVLRGTWNVTRHGPRPSALALATASRVDPLPSTLTDGLDARGLAFVTACWREVERLDPAESTCLLKRGVYSMRSDRRAGSGPNVSRNGRCSRYRVIAVARLIAAGAHATIAPIDRPAHAVGDLPARDGARVPKWLPGWVALARRSSRRDSPGALGDRASRQIVTETAKFAFGVG